MGTTMPITMFEIVIKIRKEVNDNVQHGNTPSCDYVHKEPNKKKISRSQLNSDTTTTQHQRKDSTIHKHRRYIDEGFTDFDAAVDSMQSELDPDNSSERQGNKSENYLSRYYNY